MIRALTTIALVTVVSSIAQTSVLFNGTGRNLIDDPRTLLFTETPTLTGDSLVYDDGNIQLAKLFAFPLVSAKATRQSLSVSVSLSLTRLACGGGGFCNRGEDDFDPQVAISDGINLVGALIGDNHGGEFQGVILPEGTLDRTLAPVFTGSAFPGINESFDITLGFDISSQTRVNASIFSSHGSFVSTTRIDPTRSLSLVMFRDGDLGENYQLNVLRIAIPVSEPAALSLFALGILGAGVARRRRITDVTS